MMSDTRPLIGVRIVWASRYDYDELILCLSLVLLTVPTQEYSAWDAFSSPAMVGRAVAMI